MPATTRNGLLIFLVLLGVLAWAGLRGAEGYFNLPGLAIVLGGCVVSALLSFPLPELLATVRATMTVGRPQMDDLKGYADIVEEMSRRLSKNRFKAAQDTVDACDNPVLRSGLQMLLDGATRDEINRALDWQYGLHARELAVPVRVMKALAMYAPAFGMIGTLVGLIGVLDLIGGPQVAALGGQLAIALTTTLYGIVLANLAFRPLAIKLERHAEARLSEMRVLRSAILLLVDGRTPAFVREMLKNYSQQSIAPMVHEILSDAEPADAPRLGALQQLRMD